MTDPKALADKLAEGEAWPDPKITNPDIGNPTGVPYLDCLIHRLLDAQQDVNLVANEDMSQSMANVAALMDEIETALRKAAALQSDTPPATATVAGRPGATGEPGSGVSEQEAALREINNLQDRTFLSFEERFLRALAIARAALQSDTPPATAAVQSALTGRPDSIYSAFHLENWTDDDFAKHPAATRKTLAWLLKLEALTKSDGGRAEQSPIAAAFITTLPDSEPAGSRRGGPSDLGEPVAWRYEQNCDGIWVVNYTNRDPINSVAAEIKNVVPLYASPPSPSVEREAALHEAANLAIEVARSHADGWYKNPGIEGANEEERKQPGIAASNTGFFISKAIAALSTQPRPSAEREGALIALLREHHNWHLRSGTIGLQDGEGGWIEIDNTAEYADSAMYERTEKVLSGAPPESAPKPDRRGETE